MWTTTRIGPAPFLAVDHAGSGSLCVLLHGIGGNRRNWHDNLPAFAAHFHAVALDNRGYGDSDDYDGPLDYADFAADVVRVVDHFGADRAHLVGLSMGGRIAAEVFARFPERVDKLVLADTHLGFANLSEAERAEFVRLRRDPLVAGKEPRDIAEPVARSLSGPKVTPEAFGKLVDSISRLHKESYIKTIESSVANDRADLYSPITVPTLVVVGAHDPLTPPSMAREIAAKIAGARLHIIKDAGHLTNIEQPDEFNRIVLEFLRSR